MWDIVRELLKLLFGSEKLDVLQDFMNLSEENSDAKLNIGPCVPDEDDSPITPPIMNTRLYHNCICKTSSFNRSSSNFLPSAPCLDRAESFEKDPPPPYTCNNHKLCTSLTFSASDSTSTTSTPKLLKHSPLNRPTSYNHKYTSTDDAQDTLV